MAKYTQEMRDEVVTAEAAESLRQYRKMLEATGYEHNREGLTRFLEEGDLPKAKEFSDKYDLDYRELVGDIVYEAVEQWRRAEEARELSEPELMLEALKAAIDEVIARARLTSDGDGSWYDLDYNVVSAISLDVRRCDDGAFEAEVSIGFDGRLLTWFEGDHNKACRILSKDTKELEEIVEIIRRDYAVTEDGATCTV